MGKSTPVSHEEFDLFILMGECGEFGDDESDLGFRVFEEAELAVEGIASVGGCCAPVVERHDFCFDELGVEAVGSEIDAD